MPTTAEPRRARVVLKFGGTSVADGSAWSAIEEILVRYRARLVPPRLVVVHSALPGVTDHLEVLARTGGDGREADEARSWLDDVHRQAAVTLLGDVPPALEAELEALREWKGGAMAPAAGGSPAAPGATHPAQVAELLARGERMATLLGAGRLRDAGLPVGWCDARSLLQVPEPLQAREWLSADCSSSADPEIQMELDRLTAPTDPGAPDSAPIVLTQGFVAGTPSGGTVVLGRGGSDTAAACLAGRWEADLLEIWTDVPGMFTADPRRIPSARLLRRLSHAEAQEIATTGSRVLHPRCIPALRDRAIPLHLKSTRFPDDPGTIIEPGGPGGAAQLKAISWKADVVLVSMETVGMWQEVGFLARVFEVFADIGLSVDLVSTSETNVTVSLDAAANLLDPARLDELTTRLAEVCRVEVIEPCAAVSLVGTRIRAMLHRLAPALESFEEHRIHLVSQAANDLNFTVVVDEEQGERLARKLHRLLVSEPTRPDLFGPSWSELSGAGGRDRDRSRWWIRHRTAILDLMEGQGAQYVYHPPTAAARLDALMQMTAVTQIFYAMKANPHPAFLRVVDSAGAGFECVSPGELRQVRSVCPGVPGHRILYTPNFASRDEFQFGLESGVQVTLDALHPLEHWPELFRDREILVRLDPGQGAGHHEKVSTAGVRSKFGVEPDALPRLQELAELAGARIVGLHVHAGSGVAGARHWEQMGRFLLEMAGRCPDVRILDLGGGLPVPRAPGDDPLDLFSLDESLQRVKARAPHLDLWLEPGRFLVAEAGVLAARVNQTKTKGHVQYVGLATGMNSLIRPALYGAWHDIVNLSRLEEPCTERAQVVGPICETGDRLGTDRLLPKTREGDVLVVDTAGAYGHAMASRYNLREPAGEEVLEDS